MNDATGMMGGFAVIWMIVGLAIAILWIALPFAVFGIKRRLDAILVELRRLNDREGR